MFSVSGFIESAAGCEKLTIRLINAIDTGDKSQSDELIGNLIASGFHYFIACSVNLFIVT